MTSMLAEGRKLAKLAPNVCVKVPLDLGRAEGLPALADEGTQVNVTLCFQAGQALLAAKAAPPSSRPSSAGSTMSARTGCS